MMCFGGPKGSKRQWSTQQGSFMLKMHGTSLLSTPGHVLLPQVSKNDDEELCFLK